MPAEANVSGINRIIPSRKRKKPPQKQRISPYGHGWLKAVIDESRGENVETFKLTPRAKKYLKDMLWVQKDIWKLPDNYPHYAIEYCEKFSESIVNKKYSSEERSALFAELHKRQMIMQGPFWLGDDIVVGGFWNKRENTRNIFERVFPTGKELQGKRILEIGSMSGYDSFYLNLLKPQYYLSIEPSGYYYQAEFLNSIYKTKIDFKQWFWQDIPQKLHGSFDLVLNCGCLYHEYDIISMIKKTTELLRMGGSIVLATNIIKKRKYADYIKYMPDVYAGDMTYWFVIGEKCLFRLFASFGCEGKLIFKGGAAGDAGKGKTVEGYPLEEYNFYLFTKTAEKSRPLITIPRY